MKSPPHNSPWKNDDCSYVSDQAEDPNGNHYDRDAPGELHVGVVPGEQLVVDNVWNKSELIVGFKLDLLHDAELNEWLGIFVCLESGWSNWLWESVHWN